MRNVRPPGQHSTQSGSKSGSSSSGRGLVREYSRSRGPPPGVFVREEPDKETPKSRTKAIIILGIALPVLACIIGIAAWAVTTDVLRINPRPHDNAFNRFGHQGKTRIDSMQPRNDQDIDILQFHSASSTIPSTVKESRMKLKPLQPLIDSPTHITTAVENSQKTPKASDILSKLISDMPIPKNPKNFVVFAPVADSPKQKNSPNGRRFDGKIIVHEGEDLVAEESILSEEISQESVEYKTPIDRKRKLARERSFPIKSEDMFPLQADKNVKIKKYINPHHFPLENSGAETSTHSIKKSNKKGDHVVQLPRIPASTISNRNSEGFQSRINTNEKPPSDEHNNRRINKQGLHTLHNGNAASQQAHRNAPHQYQSNTSNNTSNYPSPSAISQNKMQFQNQAKNSHVPQNNGNSNLKGKYIFPNEPQKQSQFPTQKLPQISPNEPMSLRLNQQYSGPNQVSQRSLSNLPTASHQNPQLSGPNQRQQTFQAHPISQNHLPSTPRNHPTPQQPASFQGHPDPSQPASFQGHPAPSQPAPFQGHPVSPPPYNPPPPSNQSPPPTTFSNQPHYLNNIADASNNGPQYFAPPPQTFHTKTSYDNPSTKFHGPSSMTSYERVAQSTIEHPKDDRHHHHHHHHHHEPIPSNSDQISDVNFSDVPRTNDADRLGTIGVGLGGPRGITVQIGGGGGSGGLTGILPLGALGIARSIVSSLLPRPAFGLNSKVFLGVEVGRGGRVGLLG